MASTQMGVDHSNHFLANLSTEIIPSENRQSADDRADRRALSQLERL